VNPHRRNSLIASVAASYSELAATSTLCRMPSLSVKETRQVREFATPPVEIASARFPGRVARLQDENGIQYLQLPLFEDLNT